MAFRTGLAVLLTLFVAAGASAQTVTGRAAARQEKVEKPGAAWPAARRTRFAFRELGASGPVELHGVRGAATLSLGVRRDEVVVGAKLRLRMTHSPALLAELSHLRVMLNGQTLAALPLAREQAGREIEREVDLDPGYFSDYNQLRFELIGHYTLECEEADHSSLWAAISDRSEIELVLRPLELRDDLALLPGPFFDRRDPRRLVLPVVLPERASRELLRSAGVAASWFGVLADYRGARFPVSFGAAPPQHALVFATNAQRPAGMELPPVEAPTLRILDDPAAPAFKRLLFMGRDDAQLRQAVLALTLGEPVLSGAVATVAAVEPRRREPYDAPRWLRTDRPVKLGELVEDPRQLQSIGADAPPISLDLRLPPDLLTWNEPGVPVELRYRYTAPLERDDSLLSVVLNGQLVKSFRLRPEEGPGRVGKLLVPLTGREGPAPRDDFLIPAFQLASDNRMEFRFTMEQRRRDRCAQAPADRARAALDPDSVIDLSRFPHYAALPDLALFANAGYPFTRFADLAGTAVVLPDPADARGLEQLFFVLARMGRHTGAVAAAYRLLTPAEARESRDADLLILSGAQSNELLASWDEARVALRLGADTRLFEAWREARRFRDDPLLRTDGQDDAQGSVSLQGTGALAALLGFESPLASGRSVVAFAASDAEAAASLQDVLEDGGRVSQVRGGLAIARGAEVRSFEGGEVYYVGTLSWWMRLWFFASRHPFALTVMALAVAVVLALGCYGALQRRAARRLAGRAS